MSKPDDRTALSPSEQAAESAHMLLLQQRFDEAERAYAQAVELDPTSLNAHHSLAKLRYMRGDPEFARDLAAAAARYPDHPALRQQFADLLRMTGDLDGAELLLRDLMARRGATPALRSSLATVLFQAGRLPDAYRVALAAFRERPDDVMLARQVVEILLGLGYADDALDLVRIQRGHAPLDGVWIALEATAARLAGDPAYPVLYDYERFVRVYDLEPPAGWDSIEALNAALQATLATRHALSRAPFDQSLRSGTQTMGSLHEDPDTAIQAALTAFLGPIADYRSQLGTAESHPLTARNRGEARYAGCWSVQLGQQGFHVNHIHPLGWLSSAYYVSVPEETIDPGKQSGWLKFGEPSMRVPRAAPERIVQPRAGRLVLFPSYMWHGTTAILGTAPRLSMAFDIVTSH